jgi:predicted ATPase
MRIAFSGAACTGKTTTLNAFLQKWPSYSTPEKTYRSLISENNHSKKTDKKLQKAILEFMLNQQKQYTAHDKVALDRCGLDNIVYTIWALDKGKKGFTDAFTNECIELVKESMRYLDIIFWCPRDLMGPAENNSVREVDPTYVSETDNIFRAIYDQFQTSGASPFLPPNDSPVLIELKGNLDERLNLVSMYVNEDGNMYGEEQSLVNMDEIAKMEALLREQQGLASKEKGIL